MLAPVIPIGSRSQQRDAMTIPVRLGKIAEAVRQGIIANRVDGADTPITPVVNAGRATPCARAPLTRADLGCQPFRRLQRISRCSIRKDAERTKGENRQEANHGQIFPRPRLITAQRWASSRDRPRQQPVRRFSIFYNPIISSPPCPLAAALALTSRGSILSAFRFGHTSPCH
jgi:hypothetical protein